MMKDRSRFSAILSYYRLIISIFFWLSAFEGLAVLFALLAISTDPKNAILGGYSFQRLTLFAIVFVLIAVLIFLGVLNWVNRTFREKLIDKCTSNSKLIALVSGFVFASLICIWFLFASPFFTDQFRAYYERIQPILIWWCLILVQFYVLIIVVFGIDYLIDGFWELKKSIDNLKFFSVIRKPYFGYILLVVAFLISLFHIQWGTFVDEGDNLSGGWLISEGYVLYLDVFTHHFPFPYYLVAAVIGLLGPSILAIRLAFLILQFIIFALTIKITQYYLSIGMALLTWSLINLFHNGQFLLYDNISAVLIACIFVIVLSILVKQNSIRVGELFFIGILISLAILSDPLMLYPGFFICLVLLFSGISLKRDPVKLYIREGACRFFVVAFAIAVPLVVYLIYLIVSKTVDDFYTNAIWFNSNVYSEYSQASPNRFPNIIENLVYGLGIFDIEWRKKLSLFQPLWNDGINLNLYYQWIFTSFLFRLSIITSSIVLLLRKKFMAAVFLYVLAATLLIHAIEGFHMTPFVLVSLIAGALLVWNGYNTNEPSTDCNEIEWGIWSKEKIHLLKNLFINITRIIVGLLILGLSYRGAQFLIQNNQEMFERPYLGEFYLVEELKSMLCNEDDVELLYYPIRPQIYIMAGIKPVSKYLYMTPWVADVGLDEVINDLQNHQSAVVFVRRNSKVWQYPVDDYLSELISFLNDNYVPIRDDLWMSLSLYEKCFP